MPPDGRIYIGKDKHGDLAWVMRRPSRASSHHGESRAELREQIGELSRYNTELANTNTSIKQQYQAVAEENNRQAGIIRQWQVEVNRLNLVIRDLERRPREDPDVIRRWRLKYTAAKDDLKDEKDRNDALSADNHQYEQDVTNLRVDVASWQRRFEILLREKEIAIAERDAAERANRILEKDNARLRYERLRLRDDYDQDRRRGGHR
jgi:chromosome segregation ATPase